MDANLPTDATLQLLSEIHEMQVRSNELIGIMQGFLCGELTLINVGQVLELIANCNNVIKGQNRKLADLVEAQLKLDDRLKAIVTQMEV